MRTWKKIRIDNGQSNCNGSDFGGKREGDDELFIIDLRRILRRSRRTGSNTRDRREGKISYLSPPPSYRGVSTLKGR